ncbi:MAG: sulfur carrier protein ThiS [Marinilabiliaceae bacterium]|nr:sulfur carrier protein ThiS [Marinilabiliaceae bacterium]
MHIVVNNQTQKVSSSNLSQLLTELNLPVQGIAIAVNNKIVSRDCWDSTFIREHDHITIIKATRGG